MKIANLRLRSYVIFFFLLSLLVAPTACSPSPSLGNPTRALAIALTTPTTLYAGTELGVFKSTDGGAHWSATNTGLTNKTISTLAIDPATPTTLYTGTRGGVFKSTNGGTHWSAVSTGLPDTFIMVLVIDPATPTTLYAAPQNDGLFKSMDGGANWSAINTGLTSKYIYALVIDSTRPTILYTGTRGGVFKSTDGGARWCAVSTGLPDTFIMALVIDPATPTALYAAAQNDGLFKSMDGGANWSRVSITGLTRTDINIMALAIDPVTPTTVFAETQTDGVFKSTDSGANWSAVNTGLHGIKALAIDPTTRSLYSGYGGGVFSIQQAVTEQPAAETPFTLPLNWLLGILAVALIGAAVWGVRRLPFPDQPRLPDMNTSTSSIPMDGASFVKTNEGNLTIKRRTVRTWLLIGLFGVVELGLFALAVSLVSDIIRGRSVSISAKDICVPIPVALLIGVALFQSILSLRQPSIIHFNANSRILEIGHDLKGQQILFSQISKIMGYNSPTPINEMVKIDLLLMLDDGEVIKLGSVTGYNASSRALTIAQEISEVTGVAI